MSNPVRRRKLFRMFLFRSFLKDVTTENLTDQEKIIVFNEYILEINKQIIKLNSTNQNKHNEQYNEAIDL